MLFLANIFGVETWLIVLVLALLLFGGKKIPELMRGVGKGVGELQKGIHEGKQSFHAAVAEETVPPAEIKPIPQPQTPPEATPRTTEP